MDSRTARIIKSWEAKVDNTPVDIKTKGGYTSVEVLNNKNCSKDTKYWYPILGTDRYLFRSSVAESWEFFYPEVVNPIRNTNQIYLRFLDTSVFSEEQRNFKANGDRYCKYPNDTPNFVKYWDEQEELCYTGMTVEGVKITGRNYFALNYGRIKARPVGEDGLEDPKARKIWTFLRFCDHQYYLLNEFEEALLEGIYQDKKWYLDWFPLKTLDEFESLTREGFCTLKSRRKGYSYIIDNALYTYNFTFLEASMNILAAYEKKHYRVTLTGIHSCKNFLLKYTDFGKNSKVLNKRDNFRASFMQIDENGNEYEDGFMSEVSCASFKDSDTGTIGDSVDFFGYEEAGRAPNLLSTYSISIEPLVRDGEIVTGNFIIWGTSGDMESGGSVGLQKITYNPEAYSVKSFNNIYEEHKSVGKSAWFIDDLWYSPSVTKKSHLLELVKDDELRKLIIEKYPDTIYGVDAQGNSHRWISNLIWEEKAAKRKQGDPVAYYKFITQQPRYLSDAFLLNETSPFDVPLAKEVLAHLMTGTDKGEPVEFVRNKEGEIKPILNPRLKPIVEFPVNTEKDDVTGCWVLYERPKRLDDDTIPYGRYAAGCLIPGEKVLTDRGLVSVEEIDKSYKLLNEKGELVKIIDCLQYNKIDEDVYTIDMCNTFRTTTFTKEHPILVSNQNQKVNWKSNHPKYRYNEIYYDFDFNYTKVSDIKEGQWIKLPNIYKKEVVDNVPSYWINDGHRIDRHISNPLLKEDFWWFVGLWLGDGYCSKNGYNIIISFNSDEVYYIDKYKDIVETVLERSPYFTKKHDKCVEGEFGLQQLNTFLTTHFGKGAGNKKLPEWVKYLPVNLKKQLILGYLASDGSILNMNGYYSTEFVSISLELLEGFQDILFSLGIVSGITKLRDEKENYEILGNLCHIQETYHLRIAHFSTIDLAILLECPDDIKIQRIDLENTVISRRPRVSCFFSDDKDFIYLKINKIKKSTYSGVVYNFHCETNTFMCHHITTHNCDPIDKGSDEVNSGNQHSLGSTFIFDLWTRRIVAEYTGRPRTANALYHNVMLGLEYYNAVLLYENNIKGLHTYFSNRNKSHLLAGEPLCLKDRYGYKLGVSGTKGFHATPQVNMWGLELIHEWSLEEVVQEDENGHQIRIPRMWTIKSIPLLQEMILYHKDLNTDRLSAFGACMILAADREKAINSRTENNTKDTLNDDFFRIIDRLRSVKNRRLTWKNIH